MPKTRTPYGEWPSPITTSMLVGDSVRLGSVAVDGGSVYWLEGRPSQDGRYALVMCAADGQRCDAITPENPSENPSAINVRTRVHEYGGGSYVVSGERVWFSNFADQRVYFAGPRSHSHSHPNPQPLTAPGSHRYANFVHDRKRERLICVHEHHDDPGAGPGAAAVSNDLIALDVTDGSWRVLADGHDFFSSPALSPDGERLAWMTWDHPNMPWDSSTVWVANITGDGGLDRVQRVAGGEGVSVYQPAWSPDGVLHLVSDHTGWWNLYRWEAGTLHALMPLEAEFGRPQWQLDGATYGFLDDGRIVCAHCSAGRWQLSTLEPNTQRLAPLCSAFTAIGDLAIAGTQIVMLAGAAHRPNSVVRVDPASGDFQVLAMASTQTLSAAQVSTGQKIEFPTSDDEVAHGFFYAPTNPEHEAPRNPVSERPPLIVMSHGGPTGATSAAFALGVQFWTSRGFAVLDVDYRGSTGYGRSYRDRLKGCWGDADVWDCVNGALHLCEQGRVDRQRLAIRGGSAGGYTTLCALTFHDVFKAGASYYGISDLEALARDTHKFESRYLDQLIGPYPQAKARYRERSPIHAVERLSCPVIFFQGAEDKVVPPNQAQMMVAALRDRGLPVAYLEFEGEQHGFRRAATIERTLQAELYFYGRAFGFSPADRLKAVEIENLGDPGDQ